MLASCSSTEPLYCSTESRHELNLNRLPLREGRSGAERAHGDRCTRSGRAKWTAPWTISPAAAYILRERLLPPPHRACSASAWHARRLLRCASPA